MKANPSGAGADPGVPHLDDLVRRVGCAMWALVDLLKANGHPFDSWPDDVKTAFSEAIIDTRPLTEADVRRTHELVACFGWERDPAAAARLVGSPEEPKMMVRTTPALCPHCGELTGGDMLTTAPNDPLRIAAEVAPGDGRVNENACINCGEAHDGGYLSGRDGDINEGAVGPFCSQCWEFLRETFQPAEAGDGRAARLQALIQDMRDRAHYDHNVTHRAKDLMLAWADQLQELALTLGGQPEGQ